MNTRTPWQQDTFKEVTQWMKQRPSHIIGDVTARDGIQAIPWYHIPSKENRAQWATSMIHAGIPHIEIGFPVIDRDPETLAVRHVVEQVRHLSGGIFVLARLNEHDIEQCKKVLEWTRYGGIHTFIGTSPEHRACIGKTEEQIIQAIRERVKQIRDAWYMAQFSAEDATRTEDEFLARVYAEAVSAWAQILNVPDTVWCSDTDSYLQKLEVVRSVSGNAIISTHCHNDMSFGEANPTMAIKRWLADKIEGTIFGIWERTGNTDLTSLIITLSTHPEYREQVTNLIKEGNSLSKVIELVEAATWYTSRPVQPWYGFDALINRSWVHQAKVAKMKTSYLWVDPERFGLRDRNTIDVWPLSGKAGIEHLLRELRIPFKIDDLAEITQLIRAIFSPDTNVQDIAKMYPTLHEDKINKLSNDVQAIRRETRMLIPTVSRQKQWRKATHAIIRKVVEYYSHG